MFNKYKYQVNYWLAVLYSCYISRSGYFVLGYTKTGTNWLRNLIRNYYDIDQRFGFFPSSAFFDTKVHHMHRFIPSSYFNKNTVYIIQDGRDAIVSRYFTMVRQITQSKMKNDFIAFSNLEPSEDNIKEVLPYYIDFIFQYNKSSMDYSSHIRKSIDKKFFTIKYEDLHEDTAGTLKRVLQYLRPHESIDEKKILESIDKSSVKNQNKKNGFFRKGAASKGGWVQYFNRDAAEKFDNYAGNELILLGYEKNRSWLNQF